jgi:anaerobic selenocysteine-containing dehydrogenase
MQHGCGEPLGESRFDDQIFLDLATRVGLEAMYSEGMTELDWCRRLLDAADLPRAVSWKDFVRKGYYVVPAPSVARRDPLSFSWFAEGRAKDTPELTPLPADYARQFRHGLQTQTGKLEFESSSLKCFDPGDPERSPTLRYVPAWEGPHAEELYGKYPVHLLSPHPRHSFHTRSDGKQSTVNDIADHRALIDGSYCSIARVSSVDAAARGIADGDLVELSNDRGSVICAARLTERVPPGTVYSHESAATYDPVGLLGESSDRGGCVNLLAPSR